MIVIRIGRWIGVGLAALAALLPLTSQAMDREAQRPIARFISEEPKVSLTLDQSTAIVRARLDASGEIYALEWQPAANGDRLLLRDDESVMLRLTPLGGVTYFDETNKSGVPLAFDAPELPLEAPPPAIEAVRDVAGLWALRLSRDLGLSVVFETDWGQSASDAGARAVLYDAIRNAGSALASFAADGAMLKALRASLRRVEFVQGAKPLVTRKNKAVVVTYAIDQGVKGRFSSRRMAKEISALMK